VKILHIVESLDVGGLERVVLALSDWQRRQGHEVRIGCLFHRGRLADRAEQAGVEVFECGKQAGLDLTAVRRLRRELVRFRPDVVHSHNAVAQYYSTVASAFLGVPVRLNTRHGMGNTYASARLDLLYRLTARSTQYSVAVCDAAKNSFLSRGVFSATKARVVRNGIDLSPYTAQSPQGTDSAVGGTALPHDSTVVFGTVGRLSPAKNHLLLLEAFAQLVQQHSQVRLVIVGDGAMRSAIEQNVLRLHLQNSVTLLGERSDIVALLSSMNVFVLSSDTEGYSLALVEAAAAGLPIVCTSVGGNEEIVSHQVTGLTVPAADPGALARAMHTLAIDAKLRARMGQAGAAWAAAHGSLAAMYQAYLALYQPPHTNGR
jgi:glycosyltransferase involved in cell wall biosynthesis